MTQKFTNWRFNPFTATSNAVALTEEHNVQYFPEANLYGIHAHEGVTLENPSSVTLKYKENGRETTALQEVAKTQAPSAGQFRVDYDAETYYATSLIELNSADLNKTVVLRYKGTGAIVKNEYIFRQLSRIPTHLDISGALDVRQKTTLKDKLDVSGAIDVSDALDVRKKTTLHDTLDVTKTVKFLENLFLTNNTLQSDPNNLGNQVLTHDQVLSLGFGKNVTLLTHSGTWTKPARLRIVFAICIGAGSGPRFRIRGNSRIFGSGRSGEIRMGAIDVSSKTRVSYTVGAQGYNSNVRIVNGLTIENRHGGSTTFDSIRAGGGQGYPSSAITASGSGGVVLSPGGLYSNGSLQLPARIAALPYGEGYIVAANSIYNNQMFYRSGRSNGAVILIY